MSSDFGIEDLPERPDARISIREAFMIDTDAVAPAFARRTLHVPPIDSAYRFDPSTTMAILSAFADNRRLIVQGRHGTRQVHPHRAGRRSTQLAARPRQPRQPHQPHRPDRQGRHRPQGRLAGDRVSRRDPALGVPEAGRPHIRRIRRRPAGRDVRNPESVGGRGTPDDPRSEQGAAAASVVPPVRDREHRWTGRRERPLSRNPATQSGAT